MDDKALYQQILGIAGPWKVEAVELQLGEGEVHVRVALPAKTRWVCPECEQYAPIHDHQERSWRHLDTCQYRTLLHARIPRLKCPEHGVKQVRIPWAEPGSRFTALFERLVLDWLRHAPIAAVAELVGLSWDQAAGMMERGVRRGLARRKAEVVPIVGIDETAYRRRHRYVTVVSDLKTGRVLDVVDHRRKESLDGFWEGLTVEQMEGIEAVSMDMWEPYIQSTLDHVPDAREKIVFDKFHIAKHLGDAVDKVRRHEHRKLRAEGRDWLTGTKYEWLRNPNTFSEKGWRRFLKRLRERDLKTGRAWSLKEHFMALYDYIYPAVAERHFRSWYQWARRSYLEPMKKLALSLKRHWPNIKTYFSHRISNANAEQINSRIQRVKAQAKGFRNSERFRMAILFHCGELDVYPEIACGSL